MPLPANMSKCWIKIWSAGLTSLVSIFMFGTARIGPSLLHVCAQVSCIPSWCTLSKTVQKQAFTILYPTRILQGGVSCVVRLGVLLESAWFNDEWLKYDTTILLKPFYGVGKQLKFWWVSVCYEILTRTKPRRSSITNRASEVTV